MTETARPLTHTSAQNLFKYIEDLSEKLYEAESELEDKKDATRAVRGRLADVQAKLTDLSREKVSRIRSPHRRIRLS